MTNIFQCNCVLCLSIKLSSMCAKALENYEFTLLQVKIVWLAFQALSGYIAAHIHKQTEHHASSVLLFTSYIWNLIFELLHIQTIPYIQPSFPNWILLIIPTIRIWLKYIYFNIFQWMWAIFIVEIHVLVLWPNSNGGKCLSLRILRTFIGIDKAKEKQRMCILMRLAFDCSYMLT